MLREVIEGKMVGKRGPGRPRNVGRVTGEEHVWKYEKKGRRSDRMERKAIHQRTVFGFDATILI